MVSLAEISQDVCEAFARVTMKELRWVIAKVDGGNVSLVKTGERSSDLASLSAELGDEPCYIVFDFEATRDDSSTLCKTCFITYAPDTCTVMAKKFELQNFKANVKSKINSQKEMQINDKADLTEGEFRDAFNL